MPSTKRKRDRVKEYKRKLERRRQRIAELRARWAEFGPDDQLDEIGACLYVGGSKPIDPSTLYRRYSKGQKVGAQAVRWSRRNLDADKARLNGALTNSEDSECKQPAG